MTIIYFILILGIIVFIHELGHFIFAKKAGIYVYEFSLGMGPTLFKWKRKGDETLYAIRLLPIGGFVQMAGEEIENDKNIPEDKRVQSKTWWQRFWMIIAGVLFNFVLAIILLFVIALINGVPNNKPYIDIVQNSNATEQGLSKGDLVTKINGKKVNSTDRLVLEIQVSGKEPITIVVKKTDGSTKEINITPTKEDGSENYKYGFSLNSEIKHGFFESLQYAFTKFFNLIEQMILTITYLVTGKLGFENLAGPIGIFGVVAESAKAGFVSILYLIAFISINVGFINILPIPAFDGGRLLFLIIEKIKGSPINSKVENIIHSIGFFLLMALMLFITYNDIIRLF